MPSIQRYIPIIQKPYCCAMACFCMILFRHTGRLYDQEELARYFGVRISPNVQSAFSEGMSVFTAQNFDEGVTTLLIVPEVQQICDQANISVVVQAHEFKNSEQMERLIIQTLGLGGDVWCEFVDGPLDLPQELYLHDNLIEAYDPTEGILTLIDPSGYKRNRYTMSLFELMVRTSGRHGRKTGILTIISRNSAGDVGSR